MRIGMIGEAGRNYSRKRELFYLNMPFNSLAESSSKAQRGQARLICQFSDK